MSCQGHPFCPNGHRMVTKVSTDFILRFGYQSLELGKGRGLWHGGLIVRMQNLVVAQWVSLKEDHPAGALAVASHVPSIC